MALPKPEPKTRFQLFIRYTWLTGLKPKRLAFVFYNFHQLMYWSERLHLEGKTKTFKILCAAKNINRFMVYISSEWTYVYSSKKLLYFQNVGKKVDRNQNNSSLCQFHLCILVSDVHCALSHPLCFSSLDDRSQINAAYVLCMPMQAYGCIAVCVRMLVRLCACVIV